MNAKKRHKGMHPIVKGVLWAWLIGIAQFGYFGLLLDIYVTQGPG